MVLVSRKPTDGTDGVLPSANLSGLSGETILMRKSSCRILRLWNTKGEEYKSETICRDDPLLEEQDVRTPEQLTEKIQELDTQLKEVSQRLNQQLSALRSVNSNLYAMKEYFETRPVYLELKNKYFGREKFKEEHKKELSRYYRSEKILKENLDPSGKIPEGQWKRRRRACLSEENSCFTKRR